MTTSTPSNICERYPHARPGLYAIMRGDIVYGRVRVFPLGDVIAIPKPPSPPRDLADCSGWYCCLSNLDLRLAKRGYRTEEIKYPL